MNMIRRIKLRIVRALVADDELSKLLDDADRNSMGLPTSAELLEIIRKDEAERREQQGRWHPSMGPRPDNVIPLFPDSM